MVHKPTDSKHQQYNNPHDVRWFRLKGESRQAFEAFAVYRDLGEARTLAKVAANQGKNISLMKMWSAKWMWVDRVAAFEANEDFERMVHMRERRWKWISDDLEDSESMRAKLRDSLKKLDPEKLTPSQQIRWYDVLSRRQEKILGLTPEQMEEQLANQAAGDSELERLMDADEGIRDAVLDYLARRDSTPDIS